MPTEILAILSWTASQIETQHVIEIRLLKEPETHSWLWNGFVTQSDSQ